MPLWIRVEANAGDNPKVHRFARRIGTNVPQALGHLMMLWGGVAAHRTDGDLKGVLGDTLEKWADWHGSPGRFAKAFRKTFVKSGGILHGWGERQGKLILRQVADRLRKTPEPGAEIPGKLRGDSTEGQRLRNATLRKTKDSGEHAPERVNGKDYARALELKQRLESRRKQQR